eukprot:m.115160 g.115160  ORF g.115160 m.115160 type:complete len:532 (+) comp13080_c0_seq1:71-1666(+)
MGTLVVALLPTLSTAALIPVLWPIGPAEIVWNASADQCPQTKWHDGVQIPCEAPDSMPIAWHNPLTNLSSLISATDCTFPTVGPTLSELGKHQCAHPPYTAVNDTRPWSYANHQWLQSTRVFPNGSGVAIIHNEFHGEQLGNRSYCSFTSKTSTGQCIWWSSDLGRTTDGGDTWELSHAPLLTLPRQYVKDAPIAGYGEIGSIIQHDGFYYAHVSRSYTNNSGCGPAGTVGSGTCVVRTKTPSDPASFRGWNGTSWGTEWVDPYVTPTPPTELWRRTCKAVDLGPSALHVSHLNPKTFAGRLTSVPGWPSNVMVGLPPGKNGSKVAVFYPGDGEPFTSWTQGPELRLDEWMDPCTIGAGRYAWMYPNLIDHGSPFELSRGGDEDRVSDGLSYTLVGNTSLHLYAVLSRKFIVRIPVAWFLPGQQLPPSPYPPAPPAPLNPSSCPVFKVTNASLAGVDGVYHQTGAARPDGTFLYQLDKAHQLYHFQDGWKLGELGVKEYYAAPKDVASRGHGIPVSWGGVCGGGPVVVCQT